MNQQEVQYDIYYQGSQAELYALLYPLTGPDSAIFDNLKEKKVTFDTNNKKLQYTYELENFQNLDGKKQDVKYSSKPIPCKSNYFYSTFHSETGCFVWRNIDGFLELRPESHQSQQSAQKEKNNKKNKPQENKNEMNSQDFQTHSANIELEVIQSGSKANIIETEIQEAPVKDLKQCWDCSKQQYYSYLAK